MNIYEKLLAIQSELKAPKSQYNNFGKYKYRNCEDILEAVKPLCKKYNAVLILFDSIIRNENRYYVEATAKLIDVETDNSNIVVTAYAREEESKKGMDGSQVTGAASSYARKYALNGLFNIDDTKDSDTTNDGSIKVKKDESQGEAYICCDCGKPFRDAEYNGKMYSAKQWYDSATKKSKDGKARCKNCRIKFKEKGQGTNEQNDN